LTQIRIEVKCCAGIWTRSVADPDPVSGAFFTPGSVIGMGRKSGSGSRLNNPDHIFEILETIFWVEILKFFDADPRWKKFGTGIWDGKNSDPG
jgi:hypothetical protein